ncbi:MAG: hypothetical protein ACO3A4_00140 [Silvanigrellaceae bacterium]
MHKRNSLFRIFWPGLLTLFAMGCQKRSFGPPESSVDSLLDPHRLPDRGPWFEGWYVRITPDSATQQSLGVIVGSYLPPGEARTDAESKGLTGYAAVLDGGSSGQPLRSFEVFPKNTKLFLNHSDIVNRDPAPTGKASFRWTAEGVGEFSADAVQLSLSNGVSARARWLEVTSWNASGLGPEGYISLFRSFPLHWFVHSLRSRVEFEASLPSRNGNGLQRVSGTGFAHIEKNWGVSFPPAYVWMQAYDKVRNRGVAVAGGRPLQVGVIKPEAWLVGYRSPLVSIDFAPQNLGTVFESKVDACNGDFELSSAFLNRRLTISAVADRKTFGGIAIPKESGFEKNGSEQSFQTRITTKLFEVMPFSPNRDGGRLLEESVFDGGALEFGSEFKCQK